MDIWKILGIEPTKDKSIIKQAYRNCLQTVNPEDDADGFMELRAAFEQANKLADMEDETPVNDEMSVVERKITEVYEDFSKRIDVRAWEKLFDEDVFVALDTSEDSFVELVHYLMKHYYLPKRVWKYIVEKYEIRDRRHEYCEQFPAEFVDYMINNATYDDLISYDLFEGDESQFDDYLANYYRLDAAIRKHETNDQSKYLDLLSSYDVSHPYYEVANIRSRLQKLKDEEDDNASAKQITKDRQEALQALEKSACALLEMYPTDITILHICGDLALIQEHYDDAKKYFDQTLELAKDNYVVKGKQAELAFCMGDYAKSRDLYLALLRINHYDNHVRVGMMRANACLVEQYKQKLAENPEDSDTRIEMAWSHYQSYHFEEAIESIEGVVPVGKQVFEFHNVRGRSFLCLEQYEKAIDDFFFWKEAIEGLDAEDISEDTEKLRKRLPYVNFLIADCYLKTRQYDKARKYLEFAIAKEHDEIILSYEARCELEYKTENYEACIDACEELILKDDRSYIAYIFMAKADYELNYFKESLVACERAIALYPYVAEPYSLESQIYLKAGYRELAKQTLDRFREYGIESDELDYCDASILELDNKHEEIVSLLTKTVERSKNVHTDKEDFEEILMMLAFHLEKLSRYKEASEYYEEVCKTNPDQPIVNGRLGIAYKNLGKYEQALECIKRQLELRKHPLYYIEQGLILQYMGNDREALKSFEAVLKYDTKNVFCLTRVGMIYEECGKFLTALTYYRKARENCGDEEADEKELLHADIARVLQCMNFQDSKYFEESEKEYINYITTYGAKPDVVYDYAELLFRMRNPKAALELLNVCIKEEENDMAKRQMCARQYIYICGLEGKQKNIKEMFAYLLSEDFMIDAKTYGVMGRAYLNCGNISNAIANFEKAVALDKENKENYYSDLMEAMCSKHFTTQKNTDVLFNKTMSAIKKLNTPYDCVKAAIAYRCKGQSKEAVRFIEKALRMKRCKGCFYSRCHEALYQRALIFVERRDYRMAKMCLQEAIRICGHNEVYEREYKKIMSKSN